MKIDFYVYKDRLVILDDIIFSNRRRFKAIKLNCENNHSLLYRRFRRCKIMIYYFSKMLTTLNDFIKYNFTIRISIQVLYDFRTRKTLNLLQIKNLNSIISETKIVIIIMYFIIIKSVIVENDSIFLVRK